MQGQLRLLYAPNMGCAVTLVALWYRLRGAVQLTLVLQYMSPLKGVLSRHKLRAWIFYVSTLPLVFITLPHCAWLLLGRN